jgi:hypothetical protein
MSLCTFCVPTKGQGAGLVHSHPTMEVGPFLRPGPRARDLARGGEGEGVKGRTG